MDIVESGTLGLASLVVVFGLLSPALPDGPILPPIYPGGDDPEPPVVEQHDAPDPFDCEETDEPCPTTEPEEDS